jgi:hypothetical protein
MAATHGGIMNEALTVVMGGKKAPSAQAGKLLCVSETIYPHGSRNSMNMICSGVRASEGLRPSSYVRMAGKEFVDLRELVPATLAQSSGASMKRTCGQVCGGGGAGPDGMRRDKEK